MNRDEQKKIYYQLWDEAQKLADYVEGYAPYEERIEKLPELNALVERLREGERLIWPEKDRSKDDLRQFLACFPGVKSFQTFDDDADRRDKRLTGVHHVGQLMSSDYAKFKALNDRGAGIYMTINETNGHGRTAADIVKIRAVYADFDGTPLLPVWEYNPSIVIETSPGKFHAHWLVEDNLFPVEGFRQVQESIIEKLGTDEKVKDVSRVMRVPGFYHKKSKPYMSRIIYYDPDKKYTFSELSEMFPPLPAEQWSADRWKKKELQNDGEYRGSYGAPDGCRNDHLVKRFGGMKKRGLSWPEIEAELYKEGGACIPPLSEKEIKAIIRSVRRYY